MWPAAFEAWGGALHQTSMPFGDTVNFVVCIGSRMRLKRAASYHTLLNSCHRLTVTFCSNCLKIGVAPKLVSCCTATSKYSLASCRRPSATHASIIRILACSAHVGVSHHWNTMVLCRGGQVLLSRRKQKPVKSHANAEGNGRQRYEDRERRGY